MNHRTIIAAAAVSSGIALTLSAAPARAQEYPWCGYVSMFQGQQQSCTFSTLAQCRAFVSPNGYCDTNPRGSLARGAAVRAYGHADKPRHRR